MNPLQDILDADLDPSETQEWIEALSAVRFERRLGVLPIKDLPAIKQALARTYGLPRSLRST
jgi:hypothetical protein